MLELRIDCEPKDTQDIIAKIIHESLVGYEEYKNNNILLNKDGDYITLLIGPENGHDRKIKVSCLVSRVIAD